MSNRRIALLLLVPAIAMATRSHRQRHIWMHAAAEDGDAAFSGQEGHHGRGPWGGRGRRPGGTDVPPMFNFGGIPPKLTAKLDEWHRAAHGRNLGATDTVV